MDFSIEMTDMYRIFLKDCGVCWSDRNYVLTRIKNEGVHFVTKTLPKFAKAVLTALQSGHFCDPTDLSDFAWKGGLPKFLQGYLKGIFGKNGVLKAEPDALALSLIRQVCEYSYKLALDFDESVLEQAEKDFVKCDESLPCPSDLDSSFLERIRKNVERHYSFPSSDEVLTDYRPRFGPGTFADDSTSSASAWYLRKGENNSRTTIPASLSGIGGYFKSYPASPEKVQLGKDSSECSELLFVPKDSRGPRVIIREPLKRLMVQMSYFDWMVDFLEFNTHKRVNFRDQQINRDLARQGSISGLWSTIDLKEASDRVSYSVVNTLFRNIPVLRYFINKRSKSVRLPSGGVHHLNKLAGMGSGLTFATMAFLIHISIATALEPYYGSYREASKVVYVYGDDIIVPTRYCSIAMKALSNVGLLVNSSKSFTHRSLAKPGEKPGHCFRESCGGDYLGGQDVGPLRLKLTGGVESSGTKLSLIGDSAVLQLERHCRELVSNGYLATANFFYDRLESALGRLPAISGDTPALGRWQSFGQAKYEPSRTGKYKSRTCYVPIPVSKVHPDPNPYYFVGSCIAPGKEISPFDAIFGQVARFDSFKVTIPRKINLRKRRTSEFSLM